LRSRNPLREPGCPSTKTDAGRGKGLDMAEPAPPPVARRRRGGPFAWILAGVAFVLGIGLGAVAIALLSEDPTGVPAAAPTTVSAPQATSAAKGTETAAVTAQITVNDACVRAINASQDAYQAITELGDAAKQFDIARLDTIIRRLQPIQTNLQNDIAACNITTNVAASTPSTSPTTR
jgi:hypothetical protein